MSYSHPQLSLHNAAFQKAYPDLLQNVCFYLLGIDFIERVSTNKFLSIYAPSKRAPSAFLNSLHYAHLYLSHIYIHAAFSALYIS